MYQSDLSNINSKNGLFIILHVFVMLVFLLFSCSDKNRGASILITEAEAALNSGNYELAKLKIDSIKTKYPNAFNEINTGFDLLQKIRFAENQRNIIYCDSMLGVSYNELKEMLKLFNYERDPQYQEFGYYIPKKFPLNNSFKQNGLRSAVNEKGQMYIESVYSGSNLKHNKIRVSTKDGSFAESLPVTSDGFNYQFKTLDGSYEIVRFSGHDDNGISNFIYTFKNEPVTITFMGNKSYSVSLSESAKLAIAQSFELSTLLLNIENLKYEKGRSEALINYLVSKEK